jgi:hypothetical protein
MKERAKVHKQHKPRVTHQLSKRLSNALGPIQGHPGIAAHGDKRMKDATGKIVPVSGKPKAVHGPEHGGV